MEREETAEPGKYVLENDLILLASEPGWRRRRNWHCHQCFAREGRSERPDDRCSVSAFSYCPSEFGAIGGTGIDIANGADQSSILEWHCGWLLACTPISRQL